MTHSSRTSLQAAWYRHRWPWVLIAVPFASVLFGMVMIGTANLYTDDVVVDTYYKDGQAINQLLELDHTAQALGLQASLHHDSRSGDTTIGLRGTQEQWLQLSVYHVTDSAQDFSVQLQPNGEGSYSSRDSRLAALFSSRGIWYLELRGVDNDWRLRQRIETPIETLEL